MKQIKQTYLIKAPVEKVWQALVDPKIIEKWGAGPATIDSKEGTQFKLWGGEIHGTNIKVVVNKELVQNWYGGDWDQPSKLTLTLSSENQHTRVDLFQENVPDGESVDIADGWKEYYFDPIKELLEKN